MFIYFLEFSKFRYIAAEACVIFQKSGYDFFTFPRRQR